MESSKQLCLFNDTGKYFACVAGDNTVNVWDVVRGSTKPIEVHWLTTCEFLHHRRRVGPCGSDLRVKST